jgi:hypothetical protein
MRKSKAEEFGVVFGRLREALSRHAGSLRVTTDTPTKYCLDAGAGPATLKAWGGKAKWASIPVAWVHRGKAYVSYHLMGVTVPGVQDGMSNALKARMQGKTCFNFTVADPVLVKELDILTADSITALRQSGFIV